MAAQNPPYVLQGATGINHPAELFRRMLRTATRGATGIVNSTDCAVTALGTPNMSVNVAKGEVLVAGSATVDQGTYYCFNDATVNLAISASDPTNPRIDLVVAKVTDTLSDADTWSLAVVTGTPAPSPSAPAAPANSYTLAQIAVAANATSIVSGNITDKRALAVNDGYYLFGAGPLAISGSFPGLTQRLHVQAGSATPTTNGSGIAVVNFPVTFPTGVLTVICSPGDSSAGDINPVQQQSGISTAHFQVIVYNSSGGTVNSTAVRLNYIAIGW